MSDADDRVFRGPWVKWYVDMEEETAHFSDGQFRVLANLLVQAALHRGRLPGLANLRAQFGDAVDFIEADGWLAVGPDGSCRIADRSRSLLRGTHPEGDTALYRYYRNDELLYVGIASDPDRRRRQHRMGSAWWSLVTRRTVEWLTTRSEAEQAELRAIRAEHPLFNVAGRP